MVKKTVHVIEKTPTWIVDGFYGRMVVQVLGEGQCVITLLLHPHV